MIRHYLTFAHQAAVLEQALVGTVVAECWSQEKNQLVVRCLAGTESIFVDLSLDLRIGYALLRKDATRARKNTIDFFADMLGARIEHISIDDGERIVRFFLGGGRQLAIFFFGPGSGNVLLIEGDVVVDSFQNVGGEYEGLLSEHDGAHALVGAGLVAALRASADPPGRTLARLIPELGRRLADEALFRAGLADARSLADLAEESLLLLLEQVDQLYAACEATGRFYLYHTPIELVFSLTELRGLADESEKVEVFDTIGEAIRAYRSSYYRNRQLSTVRDRMIKRIASERARIGRSLAKNRADIVHTSRAAEWEATGQLLLGYIHELPKGVDRVMLHDLEGIPREIQRLEIEDTLGMARTGTV